MVNRTKKTHKNTENDAIFEAMEVSEEEEELHNSDKHETIATPKKGTAKTVTGRPHLQRLTEQESLMLEDKLSAGCLVCGQRLAMNRTTREVRKGLATIFHVSCSRCGQSPHLKVSCS